MVLKHRRKRRPLPPGMDESQTYKYIYHITKQIEAGTAIPEHWRFLNQYADPEHVQELRKMVILRAAGILQTQDDPRHEATPTDD